MGHIARAKLAEYEATLYNGIERGMITNIKAHTRLYSYVECMIDNGLCDKVYGESVTAEFSRNVF